MNYIKYILTVLSFLTLAITAVGQSLNVEGVDVESQVTDTEKAEILNVIKEKWKLFLSSADLSSEEDRDDYLSLFDFSAVHFMDYKQDPVFEQADIADYVEKLAQELPSGLVFNIEDARLESIGVAEDYNYFADIIFTKSFNEYMDANGKMRFKDNGLASKQTMRFSIDPYEMQKAYIVSVEGRNLDRSVAVVEDPALQIESEPVDVESEPEYKEPAPSAYTEEIVTYKDVESIFSVSLGGSSGRGALDRPEDLASRAILGDNPTEGLSYIGLPGLNLNFRRSIGEAQKLYLKLGLGLELGKVNVDISSFKHDSGSTGYTTPKAFIEKSARSNRTDGSSNIDGSPNFDVQTLGESDPANAATIFLLNDATIDGGKESQAMYLFNFSPGFSYKIFESGSALSSLFLDLGFDLNYISRTGDNNITYEGDINNGYKIPTEVFPIEDAIKALSSDSEFEDLKSILESPPYKIVESDDKIDSYSGTTSSSNLFYGVNAGVTFQRKINYGFGFEISGQYHLGLTPLQSTYASDDVGFLEESLSQSTKSSIVERYYPDSKLNRLALRVGLFFILNQD